MSARDALLGSRFALTGERDGSGGSLAFWGRAARAGFDGAERGDGTDVLLDGTVTTAFLGADYARGDWLLGLALARSSGKGAYTGEGGSCPEGENACGKTEASLTAAIPYAALQVSERLKLWGAVGRGSGEVTVTTDADERMDADTDWRMAAAGIRGDILSPPPGCSGPALALTADALRTETSSEAGTGNMAASSSGTSRLRIGLEGSWHVALNGGGTLAPRLEIGLRRDGGDAETGSGVELGGGISWRDPSAGMSFDVSGRTLLSHGSDDLKDWGLSASLAWDPRPASRRGPTISMKQDLGGQASGGLDALFAPDPLELDDRAYGDVGPRRTLEAAYGFPVLGGRFTGAPHAGLSTADGTRDWTLGWRLTPHARSAPDVTLGTRAVLRDGAGDATRSLGIDAEIRW